MSNKENSNIFGQIIEDYNPSAENVKKISGYEKATTALKSDYNPSAEHVEKSSGYERAITTLQDQYIRAETISDEKNSKQQSDIYKNFLEIEEIVQCLPTEMQINEAVQIENDMASHDIEVIKERSKRNPVVKTLDKLNDEIYKGKQILGYLGEAKNIVTDLINIRRPENRERLKNNAMKLIVRPAAEGAKKAVKDAVLSFIPHIKVVKSTEINISEKTVEDITSNLVFTKKDDTINDNFVLAPNTTSITDESINGGWTQVSSFTANAHKKVDLIPKLNSVVVNIPVLSSEKKLSWRDWIKQCAKQPPMGIM